MKDEYLKYIEGATKEYGLPEGLLRNMVKAESNWNPNAVSPKGAMGLTQLMPGTAKDMGVSDPFDPEENVYGGAKYLSKLIDRFKDVYLAVAAFNAGPETVAKHGGIPPYPATRKYVEEVMGKSPEDKHGIIPWDEIEGSDEYKALEPGKQSNVKFAWFNKFIEDSPEFKALSDKARGKVRINFFGAQEAPPVEPEELKRVTESTNTAGGTKLPTPEAEALQGVSPLLDPADLIAFGATGGASGWGRAGMEAIQAGKPILSESLKGLGRGITQSLVGLGLMETGSDAGEYLASKVSDTPLSRAIGQGIGAGLAGAGIPLAAENIFLRRPIPPAKFPFEEEPLRPEAEESAGGRPGSGGPRPNAGGGGPEANFRAWWKNWNDTHDAFTQEFVNGLNGRRRKVAETLFERMRRASTGSAERDQAFDFWEQFFGQRHPADTRPFAEGATSGEATGATGAGYTRTAENTASSTKGGIGGETPPNVEPADDLYAEFDRWAASTGFAPRAIGANLPAAPGGDADTPAMPPVQYKNGRPYLTILPEGTQASPEDALRRLLPPSEGTAQTGMPVSKSPLPTILVGPLEAEILSKPVDLGVLAEQVGLIPQPGGLLPETGLIHEMPVEEQLRGKLVEGPKPATGITKTAQGFSKQADVSEQAGDRKGKLPWEMSLPEYAPYDKKKADALNEKSRVLEKRYEKLSGRKYTSGMRPPSVNSELSSNAGKEMDRIETRLGEIKAERSEMFRVAQEKESEHRTAVEQALSTGQLTPERAEELGHFEAYPELREKYEKKATAEERAKEPWEMTRQDWWGEQGREIVKAYPKYDNQFGYEQFIEDAISAGKDVPIAIRKEAQTGILPHEMTRNEFVAKRRNSLAPLTPVSHRGNISWTSEDAENAKVDHRHLVEKALKESKQVPSEVLADYPDLAEKYGKAKPEAAEDQGMPLFTRKHALSVKEALRNGVITKYWNRGYQRYFFANELGSDGFDTGLHALDDYYDRKGKQVNTEDAKNRDKIRSGDAVGAYKDGDTVYVYAPGKTLEMTMREYRKRVFDLEDQYGKDIVFLDSPYEPEAAAAPEPTPKPAPSPASEKPAEQAPEVRGEEAKEKPTNKNAEKPSPITYGQAMEALKSAYPFSGIKIASDELKFITKAKKALTALGIAEWKVSDAIKAAKSRKPVGTQIAYLTEERIAQELLKAGDIVQTAEAEQAPEVRGGEAKKESESATDAYSRVLTKTNEALKEAGRGYKDNVELSNRWHNQLASLPSNSTIDQISVSMEYGIADLEKAINNSYDFNVERFRPSTHQLSQVDESAQKVSVKPGDAYLEDRVEDYLNGTIKKQNPGLRKGMKEYKRIYSEKVGKARELVREHLRNVAISDATEAKTRLERNKADVEKAIASLGSWYENRVADVEALRGETDKVKRAKKLIQERMRQLEGIRDYIDEYIGRAESIIEAAKKPSQPQAKPVKVSPSEQKETPNAVPSPERRGKDSDQSRIDALKAYLGPHTSPEAAQSIALSKTPADTGKATESVAGNLGLRVVWFNSDHDFFSTVNGIVVPGDTGTVYINVHARNPLISVLGHETLHQIRQSHKDLYDFLKKSLKDEATGFPEYLRALNAARRKAGLKNLSQDAAFEEFLADFMGDQFTDKSFWDSLFAKSENLAKRLVKIVGDILRKMVKGFERMFRSEAGFKDLGKARDTLAEVVAEYRKRGVGKAQAQGAPKFSYSGEKSATWKTRPQVGDVTKEVKPGNVRLYRAESTKQAQEPAEWIKQSPEYQNTMQASGRWFTDDLAEAKWYIENEYPDGKITYVDVPKAEAEKYRISNMKGSKNKSSAESPLAYSRRPEKEFFLPTDMAAKRSDFDTVPEGAFSSLYDKKMRVEIDDSGARLKNIQDGAGMAVDAKLGDILDHPVLYANYPEAKDIDVLYVVDSRIGTHGAPGPGGSYSAEKNLLDLRARDTAGARKTILHELAHAIQEREGFARGGSPDTLPAINLKTLHEISPVLSWAYGEFHPTYRRLNKDVTPDQRAEGEALARSEGKEGIDRAVANTIEAERKLGQDRAYRRLAGEIEARDVAARADLTASERRTTPPYSSENIAPEDAIVRFEGGAAMAVAPEDLPASVKKRLEGTKVVGGDGKPLVVYHGTDATPFEKFDTEHNGASWFTPDVEYANDYADLEDGYLIPSYLDIKRPADFGFRDSTTQVSFSEMLSRTKKRVMDAYSNKYISKESGKQIIERLNGIKPEVGMKATWEWLQYEPEFLRAIKFSGYDGLTAREGTQGRSMAYAVFSPDQIISALSPEGKEPKFSISTPESKTIKNRLKSATESVRNERGAIRFYGGGPYDGHIARAFKEFKKSLKGLISDDDISFLERNIDMPYWHAKRHPDTFGPVYEVEQNRGFERNILRNELLDFSRPFLQSKLQLSKGEANKFRDFIWYCDEEKIAPNDPRFQQAVSQFGLSNETVSAYKTARSVLDYIWGEHLPALFLELGATENEINQYRQEVGDVRGYWPRVREGKYYVRAQSGEFTYDLHSFIPWMKIPKGQRKNLKNFIKFSKRTGLTPNDPDFMNKARSYGLDDETIGKYRMVYDFAEYVRENFGTSKQERGRLEREVRAFYRDNFGIVKVHHGFSVPTLYREHFDDIFATATDPLRRLMGGQGRISPKGFLKKRMLRKKYPRADISFGINKRIAEEVFFQISPSAMEQIINLASRNVNADDPQRLNRELKKAVAQVLMSRGFMKHGLKRKDVPGYDKSNPWQAYIDYVSSYAGFAAKVRAARPFEKALDKIDAKTKSEEFKYASKFIKDAMTNPDQFDRTMDKLRGGLFYFYLGGKISTAALQLTQNFIAGLPRLSIETNWSSKKLSEEMLKAAGDILHDLYSNAIEKMGGEKAVPAKEKRLSSEILAGLARAKKKGVIDDPLTQELLGYRMGKYGSRLSKFIGEPLRFLFGKAEVFNRETAYVVAYNIARKEKGMNHQQAMDYAEKIVQDIHFQYGKGNLPPFARGGSAAKVARTGFTFRSYIQNLMHLYGSVLRHSGAKAKQKGLALLKALAALFFFAGLKGIPLYKDLEDFITDQTGKNIRSEIAHVTDGWFKNLIFYGVPGLVFGVDMGGSIGIELPREWKDVPGAAYNMLVERPMKAYESLTRGDYKRMLEDIAPVSAQGPLAALRIADEGMTTRGGKQILDERGRPIKLTPYEQGMKTLGFQPIKLSESFRNYEAENRVKEFWESKKDRLLDEFHRMGVRYGYKSKETRDVVSRMKELNRELPKYIAPITDQTLKSRLKNKSDRQKMLENEIQ